NPFNTAFEELPNKKGIRKETAALCCGHKLVHHRRFSSHAFWLIDYLRRGALQPPEAFETARATQGAGDLLKETVDDLPRSRNRGASGSRRPQESGGCRQRSCWRRI